MKQEKIVFYSIKFLNKDFKYLYYRISKQSGYLVAPAASSLSEIKQKKIYYNSLINSNFAILDSGFFCLLLRFLKNIKVKKLSVYLFLKTFINKINIRDKKIFLVDPTKKDSQLNKNYLRLKGFKQVSSYLAPKYNLSNYKDELLINKIFQFKPDYIIINLGGGIQEPLGQYIYNVLNKRNYRISIICTGAAIGFLTQIQAPINDFYDKYYLGWLIRLIYRPRSYLPRVIKSVNLIRFFI